MAQQSFNKNIPWHPLFNRWLKGVLTPVHVTVDDESKAISEPPMIDSILRPEGATWTAQQRTFLPDGIRDRRMKHHVLEFKVTESVTMDSFGQAYTYDYLYRRSQTLTDAKLQTYIISSKTPRAKRLEAWGYKVSEHPGVYVNSSYFFDRIVLIALNQLRDVPHNQYFRLFASRPAVRESALSYLIQQENMAWLTETDKEGNYHSFKEKKSVLHALRKIYRMEEIIPMETEMTLDKVMEMGWEEYRKSVIAASPAKERVEGLGPAEVVSMFKAEEVMPMFKPEERLAGLVPEERLAGLEPEERLAGLEPEDILLLRQEIERYLATKEMKAPASTEDTAMTKESDSTLSNL